MPNSNLSLSSSKSIIKYSELKWAYNKELYHYENHFIVEMVCVEPYKSSSMTSRLQVLKKEYTVIKNSSRESRVKTCPSFKSSIATLFLNWAETLCAMTYLKNKTFMFVICTIKISWQENGHNIRIICLNIYRDYSMSFFEDITWWKGTKKYKL